MSHRVHGGRDLHDEAYYEQDAIWQSSQTSPEDLARIEAVRAAIPSGVGSILDVGCGNGIFANAVAGDAVVVGMDRSASALRHVRTAAVRGDGAALPFADHAFDTVVCLEMLEHVPSLSYAATLAEIARVADRRIVVTVPYRQVLKLLPCPVCGHAFNPTYHQRRYDEGDLRDLFRRGPDRFGCTTVTAIGRLDHLIGVALFLPLVPYVFGRRYPETMVCPRCAARPGRPQGTVGVSPPDEGRLAGVKRAAKRLWPKTTRARWYLASYEREV
jgi:SAM-dependent methyltransferase